MDGTENQKDASGATQDTSAGQKGTSETETPTLTETQAKDRETKAVSDALATAGRTAKKLEGREAGIKKQEEAFTARQAELDAVQQRLDRAELDAIKGDPDLEAQYRRKQDLLSKERALTEDKRKLEAEKLGHKARLDAADATEKEIAIWEIAQKYSVDAQKLKDLNLSTPEQIEAVAKTLSEQKPKEPKTPLKPDSGTTIGGGEDLSGMSSRQAFGSYLSDKKK